MSLSLNSKSASTYKLRFEAEDIDVVFRTIFYDRNNSYISAIVARTYIGSKSKSSSLIKFNSLKEFETFIENTVTTAKLKNIKKELVMNYIDGIQAEFYDEALEICKKELEVFSKFRSTVVKAGFVFTYPELIKRRFPEYLFF